MTSGSDPGQRASGPHGDSDADSATGMRAGCPHRDPRRTAKLSAVGFAIIAVVLIGVYFPAASYSTIPTWDDTSFVVFRPEIIDWWGASWWDRLVNPAIGYPIPIPTALYAFLRSIFGENGYFQALHRIHIGIHLLNTWLVWRLARSWLAGTQASRCDSGTRASCPHYNSVIPLGLTAAWAFHPVLVESVAWLTNTKTLLSATAILGALLLQERVRHDHASIGAVADLVCFFLLAIGSRPDGAILPWVLMAVLLAQEGLSSIKKHKTWSAGLSVLLAASLPYMAWASSMHEGVAERRASPLSPIAELLFRMGRAVQLSATSIGFPLELHPSYFYSPQSTVVDGLPGLAIIVLVLGVGFWAWRRQKPLVLTGTALLTVTFLPYSNLVHLPRLAADTYLYLPTFGVILMAVGMINSRRAAIFVSLAAALIGAALTFSQVHRWENAITLWEPVIAYEPDGGRSYRHVAFAYYVDENWEKAAQAIEAGLPHFASERDIPWYAIPILREARGPLPAVEVGMRAALTNTTVDPLVQKSLLETLMIGKIPMPPDPEVRKVIVDAAKVYRSNAEWMANPSAGPAIDSYLIANGAQ